MRNVRERLLAGGFSALFVTAGAAHLMRPDWFETIVPDVLPAHRAIVVISGCFEILGGVGVLIPATRRFSAWGLIALLIAVFPANVKMAVQSDRFASLAPAWLLWARLPLQVILIAGVARAYITRKE